MKLNYWIIVLISIGLVSCSDSQQPEAASEKSIEEIKMEGPIRNSDIIRNPVSAKEPIDTVNVAKIEFEETEHDFGVVGEGVIIEHVFKFTNTGKMPLIINSARSTCGCTVPEWPKDPIPPGEGGEISVRFNTKGKKNRQTKPVTITANTYPTTSKVFIKGEVKSPEGESK
jgi:hypothetical protein